MKQIVLFSFFLTLNVALSAFPTRASIIDLSWGRIETIEPFNNKRETFRDCKLYLGWVEEWDWAKTNTHHVPGIQIADIEDIIPGADIVILSTGMEEMLQVHPDTIAYLQDLKDKREITDFYILQTEKAVALYNQLNDNGKRVAGIFHSTC